MLHSFIPEQRCRKRLLTAAITGVFCLLSLVIYAQQLPVAAVKHDLLTLLQRPAVDPRPSFKVIQNDSALIERGYFYSEQTERVPVLIYRPYFSNGKKLPVVICLHGTGGSKDNSEIKTLLYRFLKLGFMAVAIDGRYHGERVLPLAGHNSYVEAIIAAWENKDSTHQQHPFYFDTVYDLGRLVDYLVTRADVAADRIGMIGISKGGIETWLAAAIDTRIKVAVPVIATQSFLWSLQHDRWQGRARTIWNAHVQAAKDLGDTGVNRNNVAAFWHKLLPGITGEFDCPSMVRLIAPRALLLLNTENDPNCPLPGAKLAFAAAAKAYRSAGVKNKFKADVAPNEVHKFTEKHEDMAVSWFLHWL